MQNVKYTILYRPVHPETGRPMLNTETIPNLPTMKKKPATQTTPEMWEPTTETSDAVMSNPPNCLCYLSSKNEHIEWQVSSTKNHAYFPRPIKLEAPGFWVEYNTYMSLPDCAKAVEKLAYVYGSENLLVVKKVDHRMLFRLG